MWQQSFASDFSVLSSKTFCKMDCSSVKKEKIKTISWKPKYLLSIWNVKRFVCLISQGDLIGPTQRTILQLQEKYNSSIMWLRNYNNNNNKKHIHKYIRWIKCKGMTKMYQILVKQFTISTGHNPMRGLFVHLQVTCLIFSSQVLSLRNLEVWNGAAWTRVMSG